MRSLAQKSISSHQGHPRLPRHSATGIPSVHRWYTAALRCTNGGPTRIYPRRQPGLRSGGLWGVGASPPSPGSLTGTGQQGVCREDALVDGGSRSRVSTGGIGCGMRWVRIGPTASVSVGLRWADRVASSGACAAKSARLPRVESGHGMYGVYLEGLLAASERCLRTRAC